MKHSAETQTWAEGILLDCTKALVITINLAAFLRPAHGIFWKGA